MVVSNIHPWVETTTEFDKMTSLGFYVQRYNSSSGLFERLYLPVEEVSFQGQGRLTAPQMPGHNSTRIKGDTSTNILLNLGALGIDISATGTLTTLSSGQSTEKFPDLTGVTDTPPGGGSAAVNHLTSPNSSWGGGKTITVQVTGDEWHSALVNFWADQSATGGSGFSYTDFKFGWPQWDDGGLRQWEGQIVAIQSRTVAGEGAQWPYRIGFQMGRNP